MKKNVKKITFLNKTYSFYIKPNSPDLIKSFLNRGILWEYGLVEMYLSFLKKTDEVIDIGAYIGTHTIPFAHHVTKVFAFEPIMSTMKELKMNLKLNKLKNVRCYQFALGDKSGKINMTSPSEHNIGNSYICIDGNIKVSLQRLDSFIDHFKNVRLIKIDVEKYEFDVLKGGINVIKKFKPIIISEINGGNDAQLVRYKLADLFNFFKELDYDYRYFSNDNIIAVHKSEPNKNILYLSPK